MIIAIDFDGTIVEHEFPRIGRPVAGAIPWMKKFQASGAKLILWTMRSDGRADGSDPLAEAVAYCRSRGIEFWAVNGNPEQSEWTLSPKAYAHIYIDDAAAGCPLKTRKGASRSFVDWSKIGPAVKKMISE